MTLYLLEQLKINETSAFDVINFKLTLANRRHIGREQALIIDALNDWNVLIPIWFQLVDSVEDILFLAQVNNFLAAKSAWLLASKLVFFQKHYNLALCYVLFAGDNFNFKTLSYDNLYDKLFKSKMVEQAIDSYKKLKQFQAQNDKSFLCSLEAHLTVLINQIFEHAFNTENFGLMIGLVLDVNRLDVLKRMFETIQVKNRLKFIFTVMQIASHPLMNSAFYKSVLNVFAEIIYMLGENEKLCTIKFMIDLEKIEEIVQILIQLAKKKNYELIYQLSFFIKEFSTRSFASQLCLEISNCNVEVNEKMIFFNVVSIINGNETLRFHKHFLYYANQVDVETLNMIRERTYSICTRNAIIIANGFASLGTSMDNFIRENLTWISRSNNWVKFNAVASLGLIYKGYENTAEKVLKDYLPNRDLNTDTFRFKEGGALFAYGMIYGNNVNNSKAIEYLMEQLEVAKTPPLRHGACLGLGVAACGTCDQKIYDELCKILYLDEPISGLAAGYAMGMVMAGTMNEKCFLDMYKFMNDTKHEKIQRSLLTGIAMLSYRQAEKADIWIQHLLNCKANPIVRQAGIWTLAMAYVGNGHPKVIDCLLEKISTDPNSEVKRLAAISFGFVLCKNHEQLFKYAKLLVDHYNGFVRYGITLALGIGCAGTGNQNVVGLIVPLFSASESYVRQGAFIAVSLILVEQTAPSIVAFKSFRERVINIILEKEDSMTKFGAIVAQGIMDGGGRNMSLSLHNNSMVLHMPSVLGVLVFLQYWHWHSTIVFLSLAYHPTCLIALDKDFRMPKLHFYCTLPKSYFKYPVYPKNQSAEIKSIERAILSVFKRFIPVNASSASTPTTLTEKALTNSSKDEKKERIHKQQKSLPSATFDSFKSETSTTQSSKETANLPTIFLPSNNKLTSECTSLSTTATSSSLINSSTSHNSVESISKLPKNASFSTNSSSNSSLTATSNLKSTLEKVDDAMPSSPSSKSVSTEETCLSEDLFHLIANPGRVTPIQFSHMSFPKNALYTPVCKLQQCGFIFVKTNMNNKDEDFVKITEDGGVEESDEEDDEDEEADDERHTSSTSFDYRNKIKQPSPFEFSFSKYN